MVAPTDHLMTPTNGQFSDDTDDSGVVESPRIFLLMDPGENRCLLIDRLEDRYPVSASSDVDPMSRTFDLCIVDRKHLQERADTLVRSKDRSDPVFLPVVLVTSPVAGGGHDPAVWEVVDDVLETPIGNAELRSRLENLLHRRRMSSQLAQRERALEASIAELELKERAMDASPIGVTITDPHRDDNPTVYANASFERITGYDHEEILGRNMRFLQGSATDQEAVATLRAAVANREQASTTLVNYRKDGTRFWNRVDIAPVYDDGDALTHFVGFQTDVTDEKVREQRLSVLNRLMRHNLSNDLNIVDGYADNLREVLDDPEYLDWVCKIKRAAASLMKLGQDVRRIEAILERCRSYDQPIDIGRSLEQVTERFANRYPTATLSVEIEDGPWYAGGSCLEEAFVELIENAVQHHASGDVHVGITVEPDETTDRVRVCIVDNGPGVPEEICEMLEDGRETPLKHGDGLGIWIASWVITLVGGGIEIAANAEEGTAVTITLPTIEEPSG